MRWGSLCAPGSTVRNRTTVAALKVKSGRLDMVRTFSGQHPGLGSWTAADFRMGNSRRATVTTGLSRRAGRGDVEM
jgi:hypothetical protein